MEFVDLQDEFKIVKKIGRVKLQTLFLSLMKSRNSHCVVSVQNWMGHSVFCNSIHSNTKVLY